MLTPHAPQARTPRARPTVLCIDDEPLMLHFYRDLLEPRGYRTRPSRGACTPAARW